MRPERPQVVATDLDGTLVRSDGTVSPRTVAALEAAQVAGARVVIVTARPPRHVARVVAGVHWSDALAVCSNGAIVYDLARQEVVSSAVLTPEAAEAVAAALAGSMPEVRWAVETGLELVTGPGWDYAFSGETSLREDVPLTVLWTERLVKVLGWSASRTADELLAEIRSLDVAGIEPTHSGGAGIVEIAASGVTKATALAELCRRWDVAPTRVVAFGDMPNDLPMLGWAGRSWAVANAHPDVLAAATDHTASNDDDGVARALEELFAPE